MKQRASGAVCPAIILNKGKLPEKSSTLKTSGKTADKRTKAIKFDLDICMNN